MKRINRLVVLLAVAWSQFSLAQSIELIGKVYVTADTEGIHVINKTLRQATTTDAEGTFRIKARLNDTLVFSAVQYKLHAIVVDSEMMETKIAKVFLLENINQLDEVIVGKVLTGDLLSDVENSNIKPDINFYDVGIPGYEGKIKTQNERRLIEADNGKFLYYYGIGFSVNIYKILNRLNGRTKMLKQRVELEAKDELMFRIKAKYSEDLFAANPLNEELQYEFFYFCSEDENFKEKCNDTNELTIVKFLEEKLIRFKSAFEN